MVHQKCFLVSSIQQTVESQVRVDVRRRKEKTEKDGKKGFYI
jgi:hypothetical protein